MKRIHIMLTFALSAIMFTSCEKDDVNQPSNKAMENNKEKGGMYNKSLTSDLEDFTEDILNQVTPDDMDAEQALLFLEAAMNFQFNNLIDNGEEYPSIQRGFHSSLDASTFSTGIIVDGSDIEDLYNQIYSIIDHTADTASIPGSGDLYLTSLDIEFDSANLAGDASLNYSFGRFSSISPYGCDFLGDYFILNQMGGCNDYGNPGLEANTDAVTLISRHLSHPVCNPNLYICSSSPFKTWYHVKYSSEIMEVKHEHFRYTTQNLYDCVPESAQSNVATVIENRQSIEFTNNPSTGKVLNSFVVPIAWFNTEDNSTNVSIKELTISGRCTPLEVPRPMVQAWGI